jgi:hypothetical protein
VAVGQRPSRKRNENKTTRTRLRGSRSPKAVLNREQSSPSLHASCCCCDANRFFRRSQGRTCPFWQRNVVGGNRSLFQTAFFFVAEARPAGNWNRGDQASTRPPRPRERAVSDELVAHTYGARSHGPRRSRRRVIVHPSSSYVPRQPSICRDEPAPYTGSTNLQVSTAARLIDILLNWAGQGNAHSFPNPGRNVVENSIRYVHTAKNKRCITAIFFRVCVCCVCSRTRSFACIFSFTFLPCTIHG